jgi:hypothetical protein
MSFMLIGWGKFSLGSRCQRQIVMIVTDKYLASAAFRAQRGSGFGIDIESRFGTLILTYSTVIV